MISLGRWLLVPAISRAGLLVTISGALGRWRRLLVAIALGWEVTGVLLLWRRGVSTGVVARTRKSRHIQTDSRRRQDRTRNKEGGPVGRTSGRVWPRGVDKRAASSGGRWGVAQER